MKDQPHYRARGLGSKDYGLIVLRAVRSTLIIGAVAVVVAAARSGDFQWAVITRLAWSYRTLLTMIPSGCWFGISGGCG
ncbi:MAG: hypothetical protein H7343_04665 [Undibacterium sp.]|nr:hypothetical protein [Opitutaceae bacterium]